MTEEFDEDVVFEVRLTAAYVSQTCLWCFVIPAEFRSILTFVS